MSHQAIKKLLRRRRAKTDEGIKNGKRNKKEYRAKQNIMERDL